MKFNVDKDVLKKHHYWLVAGAALVFSLAAILILRTGVRASIANEKKKVEASFDTLQKQASSEVKSKAEISKKREDADAIKAQEVVVWQRAFKEQEDLVRFAPGIEQKYQFSRDLQTGEIGNFATSVTIHGEDATLDPVPLEGNTFKGVVLRTDGIKMRVKGSIKSVVPSKVKDEEPKEVVVERELVFFNTPGLKVTKEGAEEGAGRLVFADVPEKGKVTVNFERGRYFYDLLTKEEQRDYADTYAGQIPGILELVNPLTTEQAGVVQLGNGAGSYEPYDPTNPPQKTTKYIHIVDKADLNANQDISELAWIAQENIWIQREIYRLVDQANYYVRHFDQTPESKAKKVPWTGRNAYWEARLEMKGPDKIEVTLTNQLPRRQALGVMLLVWFKNSKEPDRVLISGASARAPRDSGGAASYKTIPEVEWHDGVDRSEIVKVEQELRWDLAAVKRIDEIGIGSDAFVTPHSHRTFPVGLKPFKEEKKPVTAEGEEGKGGAGGGPMGVGGVGGKGPPDRPGGVGGDGGAAGVAAGKYRYVEVSPQARRVPVVVSLIVDQQHVDRVQTSFANSKLRFLTTQVLMNRYPFSLNPNLSKKADGGTDGGGYGPIGTPGGPRPGPGGPGSALPKGGYPGPGSKGGPMGVGGPMGAGPMGSGPMGTGGIPSGIGGGYPYGTSDGTSAGSEELEANVEIVIYGVVTLYERYPPRSTTPSTEGAKTE